MKLKTLVILLLSVAFSLTAKADFLGYSKFHPLIIGLDMDYAPLEYVDKDGLPQGLDVEFTRRLMERLNVPYTYSPNTWENISGDVIHGRVDLGMMVYSPYRKEIINYSRAVFRLYYQIVYRDDRGDEFDLRNLSGKSIAYMSSRPITDTLTRAGARLHVVRDLPLAMRQLSAGKYDAVICFRYQANYLIKHLELDNLVAYDLTLTPREYCYVSRNAQLIRAINTELEHMEKEGVVDKVYGETISQLGIFHIPTWVWFLLGGLVIVFLSAFVVVQQMNQKRLRRAMERAQRSERMKNTFLSNVTHALHTPLNAIIGFSDVMRGAGEGMLSYADQQQLLNLINDNGQQLLYFINELLQLSNITSNEMKFDRIHASIQEVMEEYQREVEPKLQPGVEVVIDGDLCNAYIDTNWMRQVTMHFLNNAVQHTQQGTITVSYKAENKGLRVAVKDTGEGLPDELKDNIFGLLNDHHTFIQGSENETPGLGLSICKAIVDACHGRIGVESEKGQGSTFWYWVPCQTS